MECESFDDVALTFDKLVQHLERISKSELLANKLPSPVVVASEPLRALVVEADANEGDLLAGFLRLQG